MLLTGGVVAGPLFVAVGLAQAFTRAGFDPVRHPLSLLSLGDLGWLQITNFVTAGLLFLGSMALGPLLNELPGPATVPTVVAGFLLDVLLLVWMFVVLTNVNLPWRTHLPGALLGGVGLEVLKVIGSVYVPRAVSSASALYGSLGVVFAILAWLALSARLVVYAAALNVVRYEHDHGTVTVEIEVPHISGQVPLGTNRGGAVSESAKSRRP